MHLPVEIQVQIIWAAVDRVLIDDLKWLVGMRLVNKFFAEEIMNCLLHSPRLESVGFGFELEQDARFAYDAGRGHSNENWWFKFPKRYKYQYLRQKVQQHPVNRCIFSTFAHGVLEVPHKVRTAEEKQILISKIIDAWLCGKWYCVRSVLDSQRYEQYIAKYERDRGMPPEYERKYWEPFERTLCIVLATSAVIRGDCTELQKLLDEYDEPRKVMGQVRHDTILTWKSDRFGSICPLDIAAKRGSVDVTKLLIANDCPLSYSRKYWNWRGTDVVYVAARAGNREGLKVWMQHLKEHALKGQVYAAVRGALRIGKMDIVNFMEEEYGQEFDKREMLFEIFIEGITSGRLDIVHESLERGGFDVGMKTEQCPHGALFTALANSWLAQRQAIVKLLLASGADPNEVHSTTKQLPLHIAVKQGDVGLAQLLVEHGADIQAASLIPVNKKGKMPLVHSAAMDKSASMVHFLITRGLASSYAWQDKIWEVTGRGKVIDEHLKVLFEIDWKQREESNGHQGFAVAIHRGDSHRKSR
ncbi:hypothetical protein N7462_003786 [Penicillium macrosclerotiorum]|uniref:uncharacterized protein n=1 Tax=Penicillium macrosclerotiorum TaxID=303699 RepID=UPI0025474D99|nr:uncharacterized protein N7462_003786 [Penicillium macrosclerotiorum]KAJ5689394.1 hypothetical protein N7462_003786 [Penicillium macrosclerotiorum]